MLTPNQQLIALGRVRNAQPNRFKFTLTNDGNKDTSITNISVGCGSCTQASTTTHLVRPGATTNIDVVFTPNSTGSQIKSVTVSHTASNEPLKLKFSAEVY